MRRSLLCLLAAALVWDVAFRIERATDLPMAVSSATAEEQAKPRTQTKTEPPTSLREGEDWPEFLGPRGTGVSGETGLLETWPAAGPPVVWKMQLGEGYAAPSIRGSRLVVFHRPQINPATRGPDEVVEGLDADTGKPVWRYAYPTAFSDPYGYNGGPRCTPLLTDKRCYTFGAEGVLTCLDLETGTKVWQRDTAADFRIPPAFSGVGATPILEQGLLIVVVGGHPNSGVVAFDAATGKTVWENVGPKTFPPAPVRIQRDRPPEKLASYAAPLAATIDGKRHLLCFMRPGLVSLDPKSGDFNFSYWFRSALHDSVNAARPLVAGDKIFLSAAYETGAALLEVQEAGNSVDTVWSNVDAMQNHWSTSIHHEGFVYGFSGRHEPGSTFRCIELQTGKLRWHTEEDDSNETPDPKDGLGRRAPKFYGRGSAILADGKFIVLAERGTLALVELSSEKFHEICRARFPELGYPCWTAPVLSRKRLYISGARETEWRGRHGYEYHLLCFELSPKSP